MCFSSNELSRKVRCRVRSRGEPHGLPSLSAKHTARARLRPTALTRFFLYPNLVCQLHLKATAPPLSSPAPIGPPASSLDTTFLSTLALLGALLAIAPPARADYTYDY